MPLKASSYLCLLPLGLFLLAARPARADDNIFPPAPAAASAVRFDGRGFMINGKRTFIASGGMEYARIPHALWRDRLLRLKRAGLNAVEVYTFWNVHEPQEGRFNFSGDADLGAFLKLAHALGLYAIVRVGPYYCAEWDSGGYPVWLRFKPGVQVRQDNPAFEAAVDRFWDRLIPVVAASQINRGGSVILVQLENEHPQGWGRDMPNAYFTHLRDKAVALGLQVPYFFSGLHHGGDPAGDHPWSSAGRTSPWFTTEFWSVWYDKYGETQADMDFDRRTWKILAYGGNGYNYYMFHGGSNFGYTNDDEDAASYDYGAAVGQAGDLRPLYARFKRAALFARSFAPVLEDGDDATDAYKAAPTGAGVQVTARKSPAGTLLFLDNNGGQAVKTQIKDADGALFPSAGPLTVPPGQMQPIVEDYALLPGVTLTRSTPLLGILPQGAITTLVAYGRPGDPVEMRFRLLAPATPVETAPGLRLDGRAVTLLTGAHDRPQAVSFRAGAQTVRILIVTSDLSERTWFVDDSVVVGPEYVGDMAASSGHLRLTAEMTADRPINSPQEALVYGPEAHPRHLVRVDAPAPMPAAPALGGWQRLPGDSEARPAFADAGWTASPDPLQMGTDGDTGAYAWYRTTATVPQAGTYTLALTGGGDRVAVFAGGRYVAGGPLRQPLALTLPAGRVPLAILAAHDGRPKLFGYLGSLAQADPKGLVGPVSLEKGARGGQPITTWRFRRDDAPDRAHPPADTTGTGWSDMTTGPESFGKQRGFAWYVTALPALTGAHRRLRFENVDDNAAVYLNGRRVGGHEGWGIPFGVSLDAAWSPTGPNVLAVLVENTDGGGGIQGAVNLETAAAGDEIALRGWKMRGGLDFPAAGAAWGALPSSSAAGAPAFYRAAFTATPPGETGPHPILRLVPTGLSHGFVWLNGHNLGRYPDKVPAPGLYLPEPWLRAGRNEIVIFDEEGHSPSQVALVVEQAASRTTVVLGD